MQLTAGEKISANMACVARRGELFYFDGPVLRAVKTDTLQDRELYRVPAGFKPALPTCTADGRYVAFAYCQETALSTESGRIYSTMRTWKASEGKDEKLSGAGTRGLRVLLGVGTRESPLLSGDTVTMRDSKDLQTPDP